MDVQAYTVANTVYITGFGARILADGCMPHAFEEVTGTLLEVVGVASKFKLTDEGVVDLLDLIESSLHFIRGVAKRPGAGEIVKISTAFFTGEDVKHDGFSQAHGVSWVADTVREGGITPECKNGVFRGFSPVLGQPKVDLSFDFSQLQGAAIEFNENLSIQVGGREQFMGVAHHPGGDFSHPADAFNFIGALERPSFEEHGILVVALEFEAGVQFMQALGKADHWTDFFLAVDEHFTFFKADILENLQIAQSIGFCPVSSGFLQERAQFVITVGKEFITRFGCFFAFHRSANDDRLLAFDEK